VIYLLDTNTAIAIIDNRPQPVRHRYRDAVAAGESIGLSSVALFELRYGIARSSRVQGNTERLRVFLSGNIAVVGFEEADAEIAGTLRAALEAKGRPIGSYDLLIAAQALRLGATVVTANVSEFARVPGLLWEDWTAAS